MKNLFKKFGGSIRFFFVNIGRIVRVYKKNTSSKGEGKGNRGMEIYTYDENTLDLKILGFIWAVGSFLFSLPFVGTLLILSVALRIYVYYSGTNPLENLVQGLL